MPAKKKLTKKEKARIDAEQAELLRIEMEKEKLRKQEEERERKLREREEAEERQQQEIAENKIRRTQLKSSMEYFDQINTIIDGIKLQTKERIDWDEYMRCNGLPNVHNPGEIRRHIHMWRIYITERNNLERNWLLKTNERTLLTHDADIPDLSRRNLRTQQGNLGDIYAHRLREILGILNEMNEALTSINISVSTLTDLQRLKLDIRRQLRDYIDDFTFKILIHIERDMEPIKPGISKHDYISDVFKSLILAMQGDISTKKDKIKSDEPQHTEIEFPLLELQLSLPPAVNISNSAIRGLWLNYDHFSDNCGSFYLPNVKSNLLNILQQSKKEWKKRKEIILTTLEEKTTVIEPDALFDTEEQQEPAPIDVDKIYSTYEDDMNKMRRQAIGADALNLTEFELNLRRYRIVGGVYCIDYLEQPQQDKRINSRSFIRTIVSPDKIKSKKFYQSYKPPPPPLPGVRRLPEEIEAEMRMMERNLDKLAMISLQLTSTVLWFEPPVVCRWETQTEFEESEVEIPIVPCSRTPSATTTTNTPPGSQLQSPRKSYGSLTPSNVKKLSSADIKSIESRKPSTKTTSDGSIAINSFPLKEITDFDLCNVPPKLDFYGLIVDFIIPRLPDGYCIRIKNDDFREYKRRYLYFAKTYELDESVKIELALKKSNIEQELCRSIIENLESTDSPRPFYPRINFKKVLKVKQGEIEYKTDDNESEPFKRGYMFSQLLEDLDQICESNSPVLQQKIVEINSKLSSPNNSLPTSPVRKFSGFIIIRETDIAADKSMQNENVDIETESLSEYEEEEDEKVSEEQSEIKTGKNIKREPGRWSVRDVHDAKFNEDKFTIQFRTGRLGLKSVNPVSNISNFPFNIGFFGFAMNRYSNMPYQTWEIKPDMKTTGAVSFNLTAAVISIELTVTTDGYCINSIQGGTTEAINQIIGKTILLQEMKAILQSAAVDIFPELDAFCYTEGSCEKNYVMEMHLYKCMSTLALSHNFSWSRWNLLSGSRVAVLLMREFIENKKVPNHSTLYVTPLKAAVVDCTEVSASFTTTGIQGMEYYADLYQLTSVHAHPLSKEKQNNIDPVLRENVAQILMSTRPLSFC